MSQHLEELLAAIAGGVHFAAVQSEDTQSVIRSLLKWEQKAELSRVIIEWDPDVGFVPPHEYRDELPETTEFIEALEWLRGYSGRAIFVLDGREVELLGDDSRLKKVLRQLMLKLEEQGEIIVLLVVTKPLVRALSERLAWFGESSTPAEDETLRSPPGNRVRKTYQDFRDLEKFDTLDWQTRLEQMAVEEVESIVQVGAHRDSLDRVNELRSALKNRFAHKDEVVDALCAAAIAQVPTVLIGPPGTAKSNMIRCLCEGMGLMADGSAASNGEQQRRYFEYLLTRYTTPEEIFGPIHVQDLIEKQQYRRVTSGYLPEAQIAFLDEIFKASSAILNTLLTLLNERVFYNAGRAVRVPLMMVFAASNEAPTDDSLQALYDRFPIRVNCASVSDEHIADLLESSWQQSFDRQFGTQNLAMKRATCTNDLRLLRHVSRVRFGGRAPSERGRVGWDFGDEFLRFFRSLRADFGISDRTAALLLAYCRSQALLQERPELTMAELDVFRHVTWDESGTGELDRIVSNLKRGIRI